MVSVLRRINQIPHIHTYFFRSILILPSYLPLGLPIGIFPVYLPINILKHSYLVFHSGYMPSSTVNRLHQVHSTNYEVQLTNSGFMSKLIHSKLQFLAQLILMHLLVPINHIICHLNQIDKSIKLIICARKNYNLNPREKFETGRGFKPRTSRYLAWHSTT